MTAPTSGFSVPPGVLAITTHGFLRAETANSLTQMIEHNIRSGITNVSTIYVHGALVDKARNDAVQQFLNHQAAQYLWFIDADMQWEPTLAQIMLETAYGNPGTNSADIVGGYCNLRGKPYLPTIDTGSGIWEPHDSNVGPIDVIRTGAACLLIKRHVLERMSAPWFGTRTTARPLDIIAEFEGFTRQRFDGRNPFEALPQWKQLLDCARDTTAGQTADAWTRRSTVGEDSCFCDKAKALGFRIVVQTNAVLGHVDVKVITAKDHQDAIAEGRQRNEWLCGINRAA